VSVALTSDGRVYTWGYNRYGQLGRSENIGTDVANWAPQEVLPAMWNQQEAADVAVGSYHLLVLAADGTVFTFGLNRYGQLGRATNAGEWLPNWQPIQINPSALSNSTVVGIAAGASHSLLLTSDRDIWTFGSNGWGQLGHAQQAFVWGGLVFSPVKVMTKVVQVTAGSKHTVLRTAEGKVYGFGSNFYGQLAEGTSIGDKTSTPLALGDKVFYARHTVGVSAGGDNTAVHTVNESQSVMWLFGSNRYGQLADTRNSGTFKFNADPRPITTCRLMNASWCDKYTIMNATVGEGFAFIQTAAKTCQAGTFGPPPFGRPGTGASCLPCAAGKYSSSEGSTTCVACGAGRYSSTGATLCTACERGTFSPALVAASCIACPPGKTMAASGNRTSPNDCLEICRPGSAATSVIDGVAAGSCQICAAGKFNSAEGATNCINCPRATYSFANASSCTSCPTGRGPPKPAAANTLRGCY
jgi:alpha-tubulin suppressor-like RCC1 family protein